MTNSSFLKVRCPDCGADQLVFSRAATEVTCNTCGAVLATPTGGSAVLKGEVQETFE